MTNDVSIIDAGLEPGRLYTCEEVRAMRAELFEAVARATVKIVREQVHEEMRAALAALPPPVIIP